MEPSEWVGLKPTQERDMASFQDFKRQWDEGILSDDHQVVVKTCGWCRTLAFRYGCPDRADDLQQEALMRLAKSSYRGEAALDTYILSIVQRLNIAEWKQAGGSRRDEFPEVEAVGEANLELVKKVFRKMEEEELEKNLLDTKSATRRAVVEIILDAENQVGRRRIAEIASQTLGHKVTRHEVENVLKRLRDELRHHSGDHEATEE
jgi:DNA-directed RNA polymerase specialized sigma24 family protein